MRPFLLRCALLTALLALSLRAVTFAQKPAVDLYRVRVVTKDGERFRGILEDINDSYLYLGSERNYWRTDDGSILLSRIRKVVLRRNNKKTVLISGAIVGGLVVGFLSNESLQKNQTRSPVAYGLTLTAAAAGGATAGLIVGSLIGNVSSRVVRPLDLKNPEISLQGQLEPFTARYQQDLLNRLPRKNK